MRRWRDRRARRATGGRAGMRTIEPISRTRRRSGRCASFRTSHSTNRSSSRCTGRPAGRHVRGGVPGAYPGHCGCRRQVTDGRQVEVWNSRDHRHAIVAFGRGFLGHRVRRPRRRRCRRNNASNGRSRRGARGSTRRRGSSLGSVGWIGHGSPSPRSESESLQRGDSESLSVPVAPFLSSRSTLTISGTLPCPLAVVLCRGGVGGRMWLAVRRPIPGLRCGLADGLIADGGTAAPPRGKSPKAVAGVPDRDFNQNSQLPTRSSLRKQFCP